MTIRPSRLIILILCGVLISDSIHARSHRASALDSSTQIIVVTTPDWNSVEGTLQRYQRPRSGAKWIAVGEPVTVVVGKNGLGWGTGVIATDVFEIRGSADPVKKEGDGKAPAGVFSISEAFGYAAEAKPGTKMPYLPLTTSIECVDDTSSRFYNRVLDRSSVTPDWNSSEHMLRSDELYRWGIVVDHNSNPPEAGAGSCIFMHIWRGRGRGTVGCTAMPQEQLESLLGWLDPARKPLLVQMPRQQYEQLHRKWKLPDIAAATLNSGRQKQRNSSFSSKIVSSHDFDQRIQLRDLRDCCYEPHPLVCHSVRQYRADGDQMEFGGRECSRGAALLRRRSRTNLHQPLV